MRLPGNAGRKSRQKSPSGHHRTTMTGYIFATKARIDNRKKNLAALLHGTLVVGVSQTAAFNRGRHLYSAGRPSGWALAHILVTHKSESVYTRPNCNYSIRTEGLSQAVTYVVKVIICRKRCKVMTLLAQTTNRKSAPFTSFPCYKHLSTVADMRAVCDLVVRQCIFCSSDMEVLPQI